MKLKCLNKSYIIYIVSVFYGRRYPGGKICLSPDQHKSDEMMCEKDKNDVKEDVKGICGGKNSCNFTVENTTFSKPDGCDNIHKYMDVAFTCVDKKKYIRDKILAKPIISSTPSLVMTSSTLTSRSEAITSQVTSTDVIQPTSTLVADIDRLVTESLVTSQSQDYTPRSSSLSSSRPHSVSVTTVRHTQRFPTSTIESPSLKTTKPASKTHENSATSAGQHGTMKLFRFILSFHLIREESIHKHTASSVVWFMFGLLVGLFIMIVVLVYYRVKLARRERKNKPNKAAYFKQKNSIDGTIEENVILHPKELEALEMESQLGETV